MKHTPCDVSGVPTGAPAYYAKVDMADSPLVLGDEWSKGNVAPDSLAAALGLTDPQSADIADAIRKMTGCVDTVTAQGAISVGDLVDVTNGIATKSLYAHAYAEHKLSVSSLQGVVQIDNSRFLLITHPGSTTTLTIGRFVGKDVVLGTPKDTTVSAYLSGWDLCEVSPNKFVLDFRVQTSGTGSALVFTTNDLEITAIGASVYTGGGQCLDTRCTKLDTDKFLHMYTDWPEGKYTDSWMSVCTVSGTTITVGAAVRFVNRGQGTALAVSGTTVLSMYSRENYAERYYVVSQVSGATITLGTEKTLPLGILGSANVLKVAEGLLFGGAGGLTLCSLTGGTLSPISSEVVDASYYSGNLGPSEYLFASASYAAYRQISTAGSVVKVGTPATSARMLGLNPKAGVASSSNEIMLNAMSTGEDAIAITSATNGAPLEVAYDGTAYVPGAVAGEYILSSGVEGYAYRDNFVSIKGFWR